MKENSAPRGAVQVTTHRKQQDFAAVLTELVDVHLPAADRTRQRLKWVHIPKHASRLNVAEIENSILSRQCLHRRNPATDTLVWETAAQCRHRNQWVSPLQWHFTSANAQIRLRKLYPTM